MVRLLKGSGGRPTLLLSYTPPSLPSSARPQPAATVRDSPALHRAITAPLHVNTGNRGNDGNRGDGNDRGSPVVDSTMRRDSRILKDKVL